MPEPRLSVHRALMIDKVNHRAPAREEHNSALITTCFKEALHGLLEGQRLAITLSPYPTGESCQDVLWRTLICQYVLNGGNPLHPPTVKDSGFFTSNKFSLPCRMFSKRTSFRVACSKPRPWPHNLHHRTVGYMGIGPPGMHAGDHIGLILGAYS